MMATPYQMEIIQQPEHKRIVMIFEGATHIWREIYMDGRAFPEGDALNPTYLGYSVGKWEGDTLVVDTQGIDERSWLDTAGHEHSAKLRLTERFKKTGPDTIQWTVTYDDPIYFTRPWSIERTFTRGKTADRVLPYTCNENNKDVEHLMPFQPNLNYKHVPETKKPGGN
jgi:hypothetical protein